MVPAAITAFDTRLAGKRQVHPEGLLAVILGGRRRRPDYFGIASRAGADSYFSMNRLVSATSLAIATLLVLTGCATDDDPFPVHPAATTTDSEVPVAGAASPPRESSSAGWKW